MTAAACSAFTAAHRMVDRVHRKSADVRSLAEVTLLAGLAERDVHVVAVADLADRRFAGEIDETDFTAGELDLRIIAVFGTEQRNLCCGEPWRCPA